MKWSLFLHSLPLQHSTVAPLYWYFTLFHTPLAAPCPSPTSLNHITPQPRSFITPHPLSHYSLITSFCLQNFYAQVFHTLAPTSSFPLLAPPSLTFFSCTRKLFIMLSLLHYNFTFAGFLSSNGLPVFYLRIFHSTRLIIFSIVLHIQLPSVSYGTASAYPYGSGSHSEEDHVIHFRSDDFCFRLSPLSTAGTKWIRRCSCPHNSLPPKAT